MYTTPSHVTWKNLESGMVLLNLQTSNYYTLNETAKLIWLAILDGKSQDEILERMTQKYDCPIHRAKTDIQEKIAFFIDENLLIQNKE